MASNLDAVTVVRQAEGNVPAQASAGADMPSSTTLKVPADHGIHHAAGQATVQGTEPRGQIEMQAVELDDDDDAPPGSESPVLPVDRDPGKLF